MFYGLGKSGTKKLSLDVHHDKASIFSQFLLFSLLSFSRPERNLTSEYGCFTADESWKVMVYVKYWLDYHIATFKKPLVSSQE